MEDREYGDSRLAFDKEDRIWKPVKKSSSDCLEYLRVLMRTSGDGLKNSINRKKKLFAEPLNSFLVP